MGSRNTSQSFFEPFAPAGAFFGSLIRIQRSRHFQVLAAGPDPEFLGSIPALAVNATQMKVSAIHPTLHPTYA
jgi:hypothetical protein